MTPLCTIRDASPHWHRLGSNVNLRWVHRIRLSIKCYFLMSEVVTILPLRVQMHMLWNNKHSIEVTCSQGGSHDPILKYNVLRLQQTAQCLFCKPGPAGFSLPCRPSHTSIHQNSVPSSIANLDDIVDWQSPQARRRMSCNCTFFASENEIKFLSCQSRKFVLNTEMSFNPPWKRFGTNVDQTISAIHGFPFHSVVGLTGAKKTRRNS